MMANERLNRTKYIRCFSVYSKPKWSWKTVFWMFRLFFQALSVCFNSSKLICLCHNRAGVNEKYLCMVIWLAFEIFLLASSCHSLFGVLSSYWSLPSIVIHSETDELRFLFMFPPTKQEKKTIFFLQISIVLFCCCHQFDFPCLTMSGTRNHPYNLSTVISSFGSMDDDKQQEQQRHMSWKMLMEQRINSDGETLKSNTKIPDTPFVSIIILTKHTEWCTVKRNISFPNKRNIRNGKRRWAKRKWRHGQIEWTQIMPGTKYRISVPI